jgi:hypothetical protein
MGEQSCTGIEIRVPVLVPGMRDANRIGHEGSTREYLRDQGRSVMATEQLISIDWELA